MSSDSCQCRGGRFAPWTGLVQCLILLFPCAGTAQSPCEEPTDADYVSRAERVRERVDVEDFEGALALLDGLSSTYDYVLVEYSRARALHRLGELEAAEHAYSRFLHAAEACPDVDEIVDRARSYRTLAVQQRLRSLEESGPNEPSEPADGEATEVGTAPSEPEPTTGQRDGVPAHWILIGTGGALIVAGIIHDLVRADLYDDAEAARENGDRDAYDEAVRRIDNARIVDWVLYGTGVAALGVGLVLLLLDEPDESPQPRVGLSWQGTGVSLYGTF